LIKVKEELSKRTNSNLLLKLIEGLENNLINHKPDTGCH
jgi:hypothetical protein